MRIWLVRHGESLGNVHEHAYRALSDPRVPLTEWGAQQAKSAGAFIRDYYERLAEASGQPEAKPPQLRVWYSYFDRTTQTKDALVEGLGEDLVGNWDGDGKPGWEDIRLREQSFGVFSNLTSDAERARAYPYEYELFNNLMNNQGRLLAEAPMGESRAEVVQRIYSFIETIMRDKADGVEDIVIVTHGVTLRAFEMAFMHYTQRWLDQEPNPGNADVHLITGTILDNGKPAYTREKVFRGPERPPSLDATYGTAPLGGWEALEMRTGKNRYDITGEPPMRPLQGFEGLVGPG